MFGDHRVGDRILRLFERVSGGEAAARHRFDHIRKSAFHEEVVDQKTHRTFRIEYQGKEIEVRHAGVKPDTFKDQAETVVKGQLLAEKGPGGLRYLVQAVEGEAGIMAKCPSKYDGQR